MNQAITIIERKIGELTIDLAEADRMQRLKVPGLDYGGIALEIRVKIHLLDEILEAVNEA